MIDPPPPGHIVVAVPKATLLLTVQEYTKAIQRGKAWRRRVALAQREATPSPSPVVASGDPQDGS